MTTSAQQLAFLAALLAPAFRGTPIYLDIDPATNALRDTCVADFCGGTSTAKTPAVKEDLTSKVKTPKIKTEDEQRIADWLATKGNGILYLGWTTMAYTLKGNFVEVTLAHLGKNDDFVKKVGRKLAIDRLTAGGGILMALPEPVLEREIGVSTWLASVFSSQFS